MAVLLKHKPCASCGHRHHFCLLQGERHATEQYEYRCPETGQRATLTTNAEGEVVHFPPQGAVVLWPVDRAGAEATPAQPLRTEVVPDVATQPRPTARTDPQPPGDGPGVGEGLLEEALPAICEAARKVGGFARLAAIARQLDRAGPGR
jgi:hypothetical protein